MGKSEIFDKQSKIKMAVNKIWLFLFQNNRYFASFRRHLIFHTLSYQSFLLLIASSKSGSIRISCILLKA